MSERSRPEKEVESTVHALLPGDGWSLSVLADRHNLVLRARRDDRDLVVRLQPTDRMTDATARAVVDYLCALGEDPELRVPRPVRLPGGRWFANIDVGGRDHRASIVTWVPGDRAPDARAFVEEDRLRSVGAAVARMHARSRMIASRAVPRVDARTLFGSDSIVRNEGLIGDISPSLHEDLLSACEIMAPALEVEAGIIHADLAPANWVFDDGRPGVIDFDEVRHAPYALDLVEVLWTHALREGYPRHREVLFEGYREVGPLPPGLPDDADVIASISLFGWLHCVYTEPMRKGRSQDRERAGLTVERIVTWCGVRG
jgi:Ser/Thr protein kinase RdoA (MazF antagonist)